MSGKIAVLEEQVQRLRAENEMLRARWLRVPAKRRPHYRRNERMDILWHAARYRISINDTAAGPEVYRDRTPVASSQPSFD